MATILRLPLFHLKSVMLDHFIAKHATTHKVNSYCTVAISYCTFCVRKHTIEALDALKYNNNDENTLTGNPNVVLRTTVHTKT